MHETDPTPDLIQRARTVLDWTVFTLGVMSLSAAIIATVLSKTDLFGSGVPPQVQQGDARNS